MTAVPLTAQREPATGPQTGGWDADLVRIATRHRRQDRLPLTVLPPSTVPATGETRTVILAVPGEPKAAEPAPAVLAVCCSAALAAVGAYIWFAGPHQADGARLAALVYLGFAVAGLAVAWKLRRS